VLYARVPRIGEVKTRLTPPLNRRQALRLHRALLGDSARMVRVAARRAGALPWIAFSEPWEPRAGRPPGDLRGALRGFARLPQGRGDLGQRMLRTCRELLGRGAPAVVLVGSDSPTLPRRRLVEAFRSLQRGADLVLGPAEDGGYYLIGVAAVRPLLFHRVRWGGSEVFAATLRRARHLGLRIALLPPWHDCDRPADLPRLRRALRRDPGRAPRTARLLEELERTVRLQPT
jgi:uncharacterized protein